MAPPISKRWTTDPECIDMLNYLIKRTENVESPISIKRLAIEFKEKSGAVQTVKGLASRIGRVRKIIHSFKHIDTITKVKLLFALSAAVNASFLKKLKKDALVEVDEKNRITHYKAKNGTLELKGDHSQSAKCRTAQLESKRSYRSMITSYFENKNDADAVPSNRREIAAYCREIQNFEFMDTHSKVKQLFGLSASVDSDHLKKLRNDAVVDVDNRNRITNETIPKSQACSSTSCSSKTSKRKADASAGSSSSKRTKPLPEGSMNSEEVNDNSSHDDPPRIELKPFRGPLVLPNETQKDSGIQQIIKSRPQVMEASIKKEYEEEAHTSMKMVLNAFKSLILSLDTPGLSQLQMELDKKIMDAGRRIEISNKEVILAMELLIVKLANYGAPKSSEDSISLREILSMLRTIILTLNFNGFEVILETLKVNIEQLKVQDKKIPVSKAECVLRAILDIICT